MILLFIIAAIIVVAICYYLTIWYFYPFWSRQPVFHTYDVWWRYFLTPLPVVIQPQTPPKPASLWFKPTYVSITTFSDAQIETAYSFAQCHLHDTEQLLWGMPLAVWKDIHTGPGSYISFYKDEEELKAIMTTRPVTLYLHAYNMQIPIFFWDFLCLNRHLSTTNQTQVAQELLYTQNVLQRHTHPVHLFCTPTTIPGVVPLITYPLLEIPMPPFGIKPLTMPNPFIWRRSKLWRDLDAVIRTSSEYELILLPDQSSIQTRIDNGNWVVYTLHNKDQLVSLYIAQRKFVVLDEVTEDKSMQSIEWITMSFNKSHTQQEKQKTQTPFLLGWLRSLQHIGKHRILLPMLGNNHSLVFPATPVLQRIQQSWYLYNMTCFPVNASHSFICI